MLLSRHAPAAPSGGRVAHGRRPPARRVAPSRSSPGRRRGAPPAAAVAAAPPGPAAAASGHTALLHGLGDVGDIAPAHMPWVLRIAHVSGGGSAGSADSSAAMTAISRGLLAWRAALNRGLLPDDDVIQQLLASGELVVGGGASAEELAWPAEPLRTTLLRGLGKLGVARFARKYPAVKVGRPAARRRQAAGRRAGGRAAGSPACAAHAPRGAPQDALLRGLLETVHTFHKRLSGVEEEEEQPELDASGAKFQSVAELVAAEAAARAARRGDGGAAVVQEAAAKAAPPPPSPRLAGLPAEKLLAVELTKAMYFAWRGPMETLDTAGRAFAGLEALLGGEGFEVQGNIWRRQGWSQLDDLRRKLEDLRELRDLVRSLGRGGGWGPLRRAPVQHLDLNGRPGLMRTVLEAQETRGLTRSDDISRLLPAEAAMLARGRTNRQSKLLFFAKMAEKGLQTYERDGWGEFPTTINPERREIRPTADRGPILLCVDTSGSMRGARETVAKALALECMRAAKEQERDCYVFAFAGPAEVREVELGMDMPSVLRLLDFLEALFNGGSDFNEPLRRCLNRLTDAKWANSDVLLVSDGELRQPGPEIMQKLAGAKQKLGLRVHGLIVGSPEKKRADPAVLRGLCTNYLPNGKVEMCMSEFEGWASVQADAGLAFDWDDVAGNTARRLAGLKHEKERTEEMKRKRQASRARGARHRRRRQEALSGARPAPARAPAVRGRVAFSSAQSSALAHSPAAAQRTRGARGSSGGAARPAGAAMRRVGRLAVTTLKAIAVCHAQRAAPTLTTIAEIVALAAPLVKAPADGAGGGSEQPEQQQAASSQLQRRRRDRRLPGGAPLRLALMLSLRLARGWAPAVVVAQGVRLVGGLVQKREQAADGGKAVREGTEVRALQLGLSVVPRVDPRVPRPLSEYVAIYHEWLLLLRGRLAAAGLDLPPLLGGTGEGGAGDEELMRFALCYNILQARSLKDALVAMDRTATNVREFVAWHAAYRFIAPEDLAAWQRIAWWEGPDEEGHLWLMIDFRSAVAAARTHGPTSSRACSSQTCAPPRRAATGPAAAPRPPARARSARTRSLPLPPLPARAPAGRAQMEYGVRQLIPELGCAGTCRVVVDASGVHIGAALQGRNRRVFQRVGHVLDRMYPCRLQVLFMVGLPFPLRWSLRACMQLLHVHTRRKIRMCRATDVPRRLPSQLRSHKLSVGAGLDGLAGGAILADGGDWASAAGTTAAGSVVGSELGEPFTPRTPGAGRGLAAPRRFAWRRRRASEGAGAARRAGRRRLAPRALASGLALLAAGLVAFAYLLLLQRVAPGRIAALAALAARAAAVLTGGSGAGAGGGAAEL
ncbi:viaA [Scenedesmus sp. PABB004]|nr:viaA [Scenedesmus sp. PABB004]